MLIEKKLLDEVTERAKGSERLRMNYNLHDSLEAKAQRLLNALEPGTLLPVFADCPYYGDNTEGRLFDNGLCLPSGPTLTDKDIERVAGVIRNMY